MIIYNIYKICTIIFSVFYTFFVENTILAVSSYKKSLKKGGRGWVPKTCKLRFIELRNHGQSVGHYLQIVQRQSDLPD